MIGQRQRTEGILQGEEKKKKTWKKGEREATVHEDGGWERKLLRP